MDKRSDRRMQIIFDLDNVLLEEIEKGSRKTIYTNIKKFMTKNSNLSGNQTILRLELRQARQ